MDKEILTVLSVKAKLFGNLMSSVDFDLSPIRLPVKPLNQYPKELK